MKIVLQKTHKGLIAWLVSFFLVLGAAVFIANSDWASIPKKHELKIVLTLAALMMCVLFRTITLTQNIYWINGISYEAAAAANAQQRRAFAWAHEYVFLQGMAVWVLYACLGAAFGSLIFADLFVFMLCLILSALRTVSIRL